MANYHSRREVLLNELVAHYMVTYGESRDGAVKQIKGDLKGYLDILNSEERLKMLGFVFGQGEAR